MTNNTNLKIDCSGRRGADFRMHAVDLNPDFGSEVSKDDLNELLAFKEAQAKEHWLLNHADYKAVMNDLVKSVREVHRLASISDMRSDNVLCADLLKDMELWDAPQPTGQWGNAKFMGRFLVAFSRMYLRAKAQAGSQIRDNKKYAFSPTH